MFCDSVSPCGPTGLLTEQDDPVQHLAPVSRVKEALLSLSGITTSIQEVPLKALPWGSGGGHKKMALGLPGGSVVKNLPGNAGDVGLSPDLGRTHVRRSS